MPSEAELKFDDVVAKSDRAVLLRFDMKEVWIPFSLCEYDEEDKIVIMPRWLMEVKELEAFENE